MSLEINSIRPNKQYDAYFLALLSTDLLETDRKLKITGKHFGDIFLGEDIDEDRARAFLEQAVSLFKSPTTPKPLKDKLLSLMEPDLLEEIADQSAKDRWGYEASQAALHAYCTFLTIEKLWGRDESLDTYQTIAKKMVFARVADEIFEKASSEVSTEGRGNVIYLGVRGAEAAQVLAQQALIDVCEEFDAQPVIAPYYRSHIDTGNFAEPEDDPEGNFLTFDEALAELCRVKGAPVGEGLNICVKMKKNKSNKISVIHGVANVGRHIITAAGFADKLRLDQIFKEGLVYDGPKRADAYRTLQIKNTKGVVLISLGDGAFPKLLQSLEHQAFSQTPVINFIQNNEVAIGVELDEVLADTRLWKKGAGAGIPGIRIEKDDPDGLYLAVRFAAKRALLDAGPTIVEAMTTRLLPHSSAHGDHMVAKYIQAVSNILIEAAGSMTEESSQKKTVLDFIDPYQNNLFAPSQTDNQLKLKARLNGFIQNTDLDGDLKSKIQKIADSIIDPQEKAFSLWMGKGLISKEDLSTWETQAKEILGQQAEEVLKRAKPNPEDATKFVRFETPEILIPSSSEILELNVSEAIRKAIKDSMTENPRVLLWGTDVYKGPAVFQEKSERFKKIIHQGGYFRQEEGLFDAFGMEPKRITNTMIDELAVTDYGMGFTTTLTDKESLDNAWRILYDPQYLDYGIENWPSYYVLGSIYYSTRGQMTRPFGTLLLSGASGGGGHMHAHELASVACQTPEGVDVLYPSDPQTVYEVIHYCMLKENNPYMILVDKTDIWRKQRFERGTGFFTPGRARVVKEGKALQFISYGPMVNMITSAIEESEKRDVGLLDLVSLRPFPTSDLHNFLEGSSGKIVIAHQEPKGRGFGSQILERLQREEFDDIKRMCIGNKRSPLVIGGKPVSAPPCDRLLLDAVLPNKEQIKKIIEEN